MSEVPAVEEIAERYNAAAARAQRLAFFMCDIALQKAEVIELELTGETIRRAKRAAILAGKEFAANSFLGCEALLKSVTWELRMWIALKEQRPHDAWVALVEAREHACLGLRTPIASPGVVGFAGRLETLEHALFPFLQFVSAGLTHSGGTCSICRKPFRTCPHVEGRIYCGRVCAEVEIDDPVPDHSALVDVPYDKRCYVRRYSMDDGMWYDVMTKLPVEPIAPDGQGDGYRFDAVLLSTSVPPGVNV